MARELIYRLTDPNYTIYHRAALGGLASTAAVWRRKGGKPPEGVEALVEAERVRLAWGDDLTDQEALRRILAASFRLTEDKLIDLVGHGIPAGGGALGLRLAIHNGLCATFLQHHQMRRSEKEPRKIELQSPDSDTGELFTYKAVTSYAHQTAQGTGLLSETPKKGAEAGRFPEVATLPQSVVPGAVNGARELEGPAEEVILLLFLMVGSSVFLLRPRTHEEKMQVCVVVPDVTNLLDFAKTLRRIASVAIQRPSPYLDRIAGGTEEAALRLLIDIKADPSEPSGVAGFQAVAMGKVAWDKNQLNRSTSVRIGTKYPEFAVFEAANTHLGKGKILKGAKGDGYAVPVSHVPEFVAANLASGQHWARHFKDLVSEKKEFGRMRFAQKGLGYMREAVNDEDDRAVIDMFQGAWRNTMGELGDRARRDGLPFDSLVERERERVRNSILRARTADALAGWFLRFCADATKEAPLVPAQKNAARLRSFLFNPRNAERLQNLLLFALVSYASEDPKTQTNGDS